MDPRNDNQVTLEEISRENIYAVLALDVAESQKAFYPRSNAYSIAEGHYPPDDDAVWMRAICRSGEPVGFMMTSEVPERGEYFLWRMMIDERFQGQGYGAAAMRALIERIQAIGDPQVLLLSHLEENRDAGRFYERLGFSYTGEDLGDGDLVMRKQLDR